MTPICYTELGKLFYAVAMCDRIFEHDEKLEIIRITEKYWSEHLSLADPKDVMYDSIRDCIKNEVPSEEAFASFSEYYKTHPIEFNEDIKKLILQNANDICTSFSKRNKSESIMFSKIYLLFNPEEVRKPA